MNLRYYNMTMKQLCDLKKKKEKKLAKLQLSRAYMDLRECETIDYHLKLINAEIAGRVAQLSLFQ